MLASALVMGQTGSGPRRALPAKLESYLNSAGALSAEERQQLLAGQPITKLLDADASKEVAVLAAVWIDAPMRRYVEAVKNIETFGTGGGFKVTTRISAPPRLGAFDALRLPDEELDDLRSCRVGDCEIKLGEHALQRFQSEIDWRASTAQDDATALMRRLALGYVTEYLQGGNDQLAVYRDTSRPTIRETPAQRAGLTPRPLDANGRAFAIYRSCGCSSAA